MHSDLSEVKANCFVCGSADMSLRCVFGETNDQSVEVGKEKKEESEGNKWLKKSM